MIRYITSIFLLLACSLLIGCMEDPGVQLAESRAKAKIINEASERESEIHRARITRLQDETETTKLAKESKIKLFRGDAHIISANYKAANSLISKLIDKLKKEKIKLNEAEDTPILVASFVNLDDLGESSTFGRTVAEQFASQFNKHGYTTIEMKLRTTVFIRESSGEFLLSRELTEVSTKHHAQLVTVGTYAVASNKVYLTSRVINVSDGRVLASHDYSIPIDLDVFKMLLKGKSKIGWL